MSESYIAQPHPLRQPATADSKTPDNIVPITPLREPDRAAQPPRQPPYDVGVEQALLGALLLTNGAAYEQVADFLEPDHFGHAVHGRIFAAIGKLVERGESANPVTLRGVCDQDPALAAVGGARYLVDLVRSTITVVNTPDYGRHIRDLYLRRQLVALGEEVTNDAYRQDLDDPAAAQIERAEAKLYGIATRGLAEGGLAIIDPAIARAVDTAKAAHKRGRRTVGVATGLVDLDEKLGGLNKSDLVILAGRPSMGKTALAINIAFNAAYRDPPERATVGFFSLEMSAEQLATRIIGDITHVGADRMRRGAVSDEDIERFPGLQRHLAGRLTLWIDDTPALSAAQVRTRARRLKRRQGLDLLVVDYLQLMQASSEAARERRVFEVTEISRGLKAVAKELAVPVLALSQLSRAVEQREDKRPLLSDLRESGSIEQDADVVLFIYRREYYERKAADARNLAEIIIAKNRHGPTDTVELRFDHKTTRFSNLA